MTVDAFLAAWHHPAETDVGTMARAALDGAPAQLEVTLLASTGDTITVQVVAGAPPLEPGALVYVEGRGAFELFRREPWPRGRVLLKLRAWPARSS
jgi:hypothetical protein